MNQYRCLNYIISVKTKEPIDEDVTDKVRREINLGIWKTLGGVLPREINCIVDSSLYSDFQNQRETVLDEVLQLPQRREQPNGSMYIYVNDVKELRQSRDDLE